LIRGCPGFGISSSLFDDTMEAPLPPSSINLQSTETANKSATNLRAGARETAFRRHTSVACADAEGPRRIRSAGADPQFVGPVSHRRAGYRHRPDGSLVTVRAGRDGERAESLLHRRE